MRPDRKENATGGASPVLDLKIAARDRAIEIDAGAIQTRRRAGFQAAPVKPIDFSDSARSTDGGSPNRPAGRCSGPI